MARSPSITLVISIVFLLTVLSCDRLPKDSHGTTDKIRSTGEMRVGITEEEPFIKLINGEPHGAEIEIIKRFAASMGAKPVWSVGGEERLINALSHYELDMVAGGLTSSTPWVKHVGITSPYRHEQVFAVGPGENELVRRLDDFTFQNRADIEELFAKEVAEK